MKKFIKRFFISIGVLIVLIIGSAIVLPIVFKDKIIQMVKDEANKNLNAVLNFGTFDLTLIKTFPDFGLTLNDLSLAGIDEFKGDTLVSVKQLLVDVNLMSVIKGDQYKINAVVLDHPRIHALVTKDGKANWDIAKPSADTTKKEAEEPTKFKLTLKRFEIIEGYIFYKDDKGGMKSVITGLNHTLKGDFTQDNFLMETNTTMSSLDLLMGGVKYMNKVSTRFKVDMDMDMPNSKYTFKENEFQLNELILGLDGYVAMPGEDIDMDLKLKTNKLEFKHLLSLVPGVYTKDFADVKTAGKLALSAFVKGIYNEKKMPAFGANLKVESAMFKYPSLPKSVDNININVDVKNKDGQPDNTFVDIHKFHLEMAGNPVDIAMHISTPVSDPNIDGAVKAKIDLTSVKDFIPLESDQSLTGLITSDVELKGRMSSIEKEKYEEFSAKGQFNVQGMDYKSKDTPYGVTINNLTLNFTPQVVELAAFDSKIGKSDIKATGKLENFLAYALKDEMLKGSFSMNSNMLDLNEFMSDEEEAAEQPAAADTAAMSVIEVPSNLDFVLSSNIANLHYDNITINDVAGTVIIRDSKVDMQNLKMRMLDGSMVMSGSYDTKNPKSPGISFDLNITEFDLQKTASTFASVGKMAPIAKYGRGKYSTTLKLIGKLNDKMEPDLKSLTGGGLLQSKAIRVEGFEPFNKVADALKMDKYKNMQLENINASFEFRDGRVFVKPMDIKMDNSKVNIEGSNGFDQTLDYKMRFEMPRKDLGGAANNVMTGLLSQANAKGANMSLGETVKVFALVTGTVTDPKIKLDLKEQAAEMKENLKDAAKEQVDKLKGEAEAKAKAEADRLKAEAEAKAKAEADKLKAEADKAKAEAEAKAKAEADKAKKEAENKAKEEMNKLKGKIKLPK